MAVAAGKVLVDVQFNADTKQLEKVVQDAEGKVITQKLELDTGGLEGPLKDLQEFTARLASGGFGKGLEQLSEAKTAFQAIRQEGGDMASAVSAGLSKIGVQGDAAFKLIATGATFAVGGLIALASATFKAASETEQEVLAFNAAKIASNEYSAAIAGVVRASEALAVQNAAFAAGVRLNATEVAAVVNQARNMGRITGDSAEALRLHTAAAGGDATAMRALGQAYDEFATRSENARRAVQAFQQQQAAGGNVELSYQEEAERGWNGIKAAVGFVAKYITDILVPSKEALDFLRDIETTARNWLGVTRQISEAELVAQRQRQQAVATALAVEERALQVKKAQTELAFQDARRAVDVVRIAEEGESRDQQRVRLAQELHDVQESIARISALTGGTIEEQLQRENTLNGLRQRAVGLIQNKNQLESFSSRLAALQNDRLVQRAMAEGLGTRQNVQQLTLSQQINEALKRRNEILAEVQLNNGRITEQQRAQLAEVQQAADTLRAQRAQEAAARRQREEQEFNDRMAKERQIREEREAALENRRRLDQEIRDLARTLVQEDEDRARKTREQETTLYGIRASNLQAGIALAQTALQHQAEGIALTQSETEALGNYNRMLQERQFMNSVNESSIQSIRTELENENLTLERRVELERQLSDRIGQRVQFQAQEQERNQRLLEQNNALAFAMIQTAGGYKTVAQNATGLATGALTKLGGALSNVIGAAIEGEQSFAEAVGAALKSMLTSIAQESAVQALYQTAIGFGKLAINDIPAATNAFTSAGMFAGVAAVAGIGAARIPGPKETPGATGAAGGSASGGTPATPTEEERGGPVVININTRLFDTAENVEDALARAVESSMRRRGRR